MEQVMRHHGNPEEIASAEQALVAADSALFAARSRLTKAQNAIAPAKQALRLALRNFTQPDAMTPVEAAQEFCAASLAHRAAAAAGQVRAAEHNPGPNYIDHLGYRGTDAESFTRKQIRHGHSRAILAHDGRRIYPPSMRGRFVGTP
jgi:hypothetical protein